MCVCALASFFIFLFVVSEGSPKCSLSNIHPCFVLYYCVFFPQKEIDTAHACEDDTSSQDGQGGDWYVHFFSCSMIILLVTALFLLCILLSSVCTSCEGDVCELSFGYTLLATLWSIIDSFRGNIFLTCVSCLTNVVHFLHFLLPVCVFRKGRGRNNFVWTSVGATIFNVGQS